jgi:MFS family permease
MAGVRYVRLSPDIVRVLARALLFGSAAGAVQALLPLVARNLLHGGATTYGFALGSFGIGAVAGAVLAVRLRASRSSDFVVGSAAAAMTIGAAGTALSPLLSITLAVLFIAGAGWVAALSTFNTVIQLSSPRWVVGRVVAIYQMANFGGMALGSWLFGRIADGQGVGEALLLAAGLQAAGLVLPLLLPLPPRRPDNLDPYDGWEAPARTLDLTQRSGPIAIEVEARISEEKVGLFVELMSRRRRLRLRNGARRWTLERDMADPTKWIERFEFATWLDYSRYHARETVSERAIVRELGDLISPGTDIIVRRLLARPSLGFGRQRPSAPQLIDPAAPQQ